MSTASLPVVLPMVCVCKLQDMEVADEFLEQTYKLLPGNIYAANFLNAVVYDLEIYYRAHITKIYCDQWAAVVVQRSDGSIVFCECDRVEDGVAAIWRWFYETQPRTEK
jgi:hypothetical protein